MMLSRVKFLFILFLNIYVVHSSKSQSKNPSSRKKNWFDDEKCYQSVPGPGVICEENLNESLCYGSKITFPFASLSHTTNTPSSATSLYGDYSGLPECWTLFMDLICSIQFAPCLKNKVKLVPKDLCSKTQEMCPFLIETHLWPTDVGNCTDPKIFGHSGDPCHHVPDNEAIFQWNLSSAKTCLHPLVYSKFEPGWRLPHCAFNCTSHWLTQSEHEHLNQVVSIGSISAFVVTLFTLTTLALANWKRLSIVLPTNPITNFACMPLKWYLLSNCFAIGAWVLQYFPGVRNLIMCRDDGSLRRFEIEKQQNLSCCFQFLIFYCGIIISPYYLSIFSYVMCIYRDKEKNSYTEINQARKVSYWCHIGWALPVVLAVFLFINQEIEADGISGICFIGYSQPFKMFIFVYSPIGFFWFLSLAFYARAICRRNAFSSADAVANVDDSLLKSKKANYPIFQLAFICLIQSASLAISLFLQIKRMFMQEIMNESFSNFLQCQLKARSNYECKLENRPDVRLTEMHLLMFFVCVILTDAIILFGGNILFVWMEIAKRCLRIRSLLTTKVAPPLINDKPTDIDSNCDAKSQSNISSANSNFADALNKIDTHKSKKRFINKMNSRTSSHRESCTFSRTPSSLKSGSLPTGLNFSMTELPFDDMNKKSKIPQFWMNPYAQWGYGAPWPMFYPQFSPVMPPADSAYFDGKMSSRGMTETKVKDATVSDSKQNINVSGSPHSASVVDSASFPMKYCYYPPPPHHNPWLSMYAAGPWTHMNYFPQCPTNIVAPSPPKSETVTNNVPDVEERKKCAEKNVDETIQEPKIESQQTERISLKNDEENEENICSESDYSSENESFTSSNFDEEEEEFVRKKLAQLSLEQLNAER